MHSLLSPNDLKAYREAHPNETPKLKSTLAPLGDKETVHAVQSLVKDITFTQVERRYADPPLRQQQICLVSFIPSKEAKPDADKIFGMMKVRGVFPTEEEANEHAEYLIRNVDSVHSIYHAFVGRPFPITTETGYETEIRNIDIRKKNIDLISQDILDKKRKEQKEMEEIQNREKELLEESQRNAEDQAPDPFETYITNQVKRAQLLWTYKETYGKMKQMKDSIEKANEEIERAQAENPEFLDRYRDKYMEARRSAGIKDDDESFLRYLGMDSVPELGAGVDIHPTSSEN